MNPMRSEKFTCISLVILMMTFAAQAGTIKGTIYYEGPIPKLKPINMQADPICHAKHDSPVLPESIVLGEGQTMGNVFVQIKNPPRKAYKTPEEPVVISQKGCIYSPHVLGVMVDQPLKILNEDGTLHNVHALCRTNKEFNMAMPKFRKVATKTFTKAESVFLMKCDVHPWMQSWISVMSHPYFATTTKDGTYEIKGLPKGEYVIEVWHEKLKTQTLKVKIAGKDDVQLADFTYQHPSLKKAAK